MYVGMNVCMLYQTDVLVGLSRGSVEECRHKQKGKRYVRGEDGHMRQVSSREDVEKLLGGVHDCFQRFFCC